MGEHPVSERDPGPGALLTSAVCVVFSDTPPDAMHREAVQKAQIWDFVLGPGPEERAPLGEDG